MKLTIAQLNLKPGDIYSNILKAKEAYLNAEKQDSDIIVYPELTTFGYQPYDILENKEIIKLNVKAIKDFSKIVKKTVAVIGFVSLNKKEGKRLFNSAAVISNGRIIKIFNKNLLPTYDIFDERRYFEEGDNYEAIEIKGRKVLITICEDIWADTELLPDKNLYKKNILSNYKSDLILNLSASPYYYGKCEKRKKVLKKLAKKYNSDIIYVNCVGANDELIFDGSSMLVTKKSNIFQLSPFEEKVETIDIENFKNFEIKEDISFIEKALITGIRDFFYKQKFNKAVIGISGGIDSAVVAYLATKALGNNNVCGLIMPSKFTSSKSITDAVKLLENLNLKYEIISINDIYESYKKLLKLDDTVIDLTLQNIQSRIRSNILMAYSNKYGFIVLNTSNKSEIAMGYSTLYGDSCGALSVIGDLFKTDVYELANHINREKEIIPQSIINKVPTAELKPNQKDEDDLPPYKILDKILKLYIEEGLTPRAIIKKIGKSNLVFSIIQRVESNEYKRKQMPLILKVSKKAFGSGRKMPVVKNIIV